MANHTSIFRRTASQTGGTPPVCKSPPPPPPPPSTMSPCCPLVTIPNRLKLNFGTGWQGNIDFTNPPPATSPIGGDWGQYWVFTIGGILIPQWMPGAGTNNTFTGYLALALTCTGTGCAQFLLTTQWRIGNPLVGFTTCGIGLPIFGQRRPAPGCSCNPLLLSFPDPPPAAQNCLGPNAAGSGMGGCLGVTLKT